MQKVRSNGNRERYFISLKNKHHTVIDERIIRLKDLAQKMPEAIEAYKESSKENLDSLKVLDPKTRRDKSVWSVRA